jgi:hypothetical protein
MKLVWRLGSRQHMIHRMAYLRCAISHTFVWHRRRPPPAQENNPKGGLLRRDGACPKEHMQRHDTKYLVSKWTVGPLQNSSATERTRICESGTHISSQVDEATILRHPLVQADVVEPYRQGSRNVHNECQVRELRFRPGSFLLAWRESAGVQRRYGTVVVPFRCAEPVKQPSHIMVDN